MNSCRMHGHALLLGVALASFSVFTGPVFAQSQPSATKGVPGISCYLPPLKLTDADVMSFLDRAEDDLASFEGAGLPLSTRVRMLAASDVRTLAPILAHVRKLSASAPTDGAQTMPTPTTPTQDSAQPGSGALPSNAGAPLGADGTTTQAQSQPVTPPSANPSAAAGALPPPAYLKNLQLAAIADGLAAASVSCSRVGNELGTIIQEEVVKTGDEAFMQAFVKALEAQNINQIETAAIGPAGAAAGASAIGNDGQAGSNTGPFGDDSIPTTSGQFSVGGGRSVYFSDNGSGGSDDPQISPTQP